LCVFFHVSRPRSVHDKHFVLLFNLDKSNFTRSTAKGKDGTIKMMAQSVFFIQKAWMDTTTNDKDIQLIKHLIVRKKHSSRKVLILPFTFSPFRVSREAIKMFLLEIASIL
jgi:hypothetical protein